MTATASSPTLSGALLIGGERITAASGGTYRHVYPGTGLPNASIPLAGRSEVDRAVDSAWDAHREWMSYPSIAAATCCSRWPMWCATTSPS